VEAATLRRLLVLVKGLPPESATWRNGDPWSQTEHFLAALLENSDYWGRYQVARTGVKSADLPEQIRITRPTPREED
jgi:hypothetical protein